MASENKTSIIITAVDQTAGAFNSISGNLSKLQGGLQLLGVTLSAGAFVGFIKSTIDAADQINDLSAKVGVGIKELAGYKLAAEQSGTSLEAVAKGIKGLATYFNEHADRLKAAGITAKTADEAMIQLADTFAAMPDGMQKTALATQLFGKAGLEMIPMLNLGSRGLQEAKDKAAAYGEKMKELAPQADHFNDLLAELKLSSSAAGMSIATSMLPAMTSITKAMAEAAKEGSILKTLWVGFGGIGAQIFNPLAAVIKQIGASASEASAEFNEFLASLSSGNPRQVFLKTAIQERQNAKRIYAEIAALGDGLGLDKTSPTDGNNNKVSDAAAAAAARRAKALLDSGEAAKKSADTYRQLTQSIAEYQAQLTAQEEKQGKLTKAEELAIQAKLKLTAAQVAQLKPALDKIAADERELALQEAMNKRAADAIAAAEKETESIAQQVIAQNQQNETIGLTKAQIDALEASRLDEQISAKQTLLAIFAETDGRSAQVLEIQKQIDALNELKSAKLAGAARQTIADEAKKNAEEWKRFTDDIERGLTDALMRGFEGGKDAGKNFVDSLKNLLKTTVLKIAVQAIVSPISSGVQGILGSAAVGGGGGGLGNLLSLGSSANSLFGGIGSAYGGFASSGLGSALGLSTATAAGYAAPVYASSLAGGGLLSAGSGTAAGGLTSFGAGLGAALPWIGGALAIGSALGLFGGKGGGPKIEGDALYNLSGTASTYAGNAPLYTGSGSNAQMRDLLAGPLNSLQTVIKQLGGALNTQIAFGFDSDPRGTAQNRISSMVGGIYLANGTNYGRGDAELQAGITKELERLLNAAFDLASFDPVTKGLIDVLRASGVQITELSGALTPLRAAFANLGLPISALNKGLIDAFGGLSNLTTGLSGYYDNFYTAAEKYDAAIGNISATLKGLGVSVIPTTREEYRRLVEAQDLNTAAGQSMYASLIAISGAFAGVTDSASSAVSAVSAVSSLAENQFKTRADYIFAQKTGIMPHYAAGGDHAGGWALVGEQGPELANLGPSRIYSHSNSRALLDTSAMEAQLFALREELRAGQAAMANSLGVMAKKIRQWDGDGMPAVRA